ncbi:hypothetical protein HMPREF9154_1644 [Arachnia propionica F0230a]|nr:hypothetical protein HMPREF9154_1644 [Arachnia propionica F0230a]
MSPFAPGYMLEVDPGDEFPWKSTDALTDLIGSCEFKTRGDQGGSPRRSR